MKSIIKKSTVKGLILAAAVSIVGASGPALAQDQDSGTEWSKLSDAQKQAKMDARMDKRMERMREKLSLTKEQQVQVRAILEAQRAQVIDAKQRAGGDKSKLKPELRQIRQDSRDQLSRVLSAEQMEQLAEMKRERKRHTRRGKAMRKALQQLDLHDAQRAQLKEVRQGAKAERRAILAKYGGDEQAAKLELEELRASKKLQVDAILTREQRAKLKEMMAEHQSKRGRRGDTT
ncbi:MAG: hypothetical protein AAGI01_08305 [Myxococcota bacterium]